MPRKPQFLTTGQASSRLGVSPKALRLYEERGLLTPDRTSNGWRAYDTAEMERAGEIIVLRKLGLRLADIAALIEANPSFRRAALARHQSRLESQMRQLKITLEKISAVQNGHEPGAAARDLAEQPRPAGEVAAVSFDLPWPWGGERFSLPHLPALSYITGPLGSGKTRLAMRLAQTVVGGRFLALDRFDPTGGSYETVIESDPDLGAICDLVMHRLAQDGATPSSALRTLVAAIHLDETPLVIDMVEQGLDCPTQLALARHLRHRAHSARPLILMTRSSAILDLALAESGETIIYCPANHSPPLIVRPDPRCPGYEAVATCLAAPEVRARTAGIVAAREATANDSRETFS